MVLLTAHTRDEVLIELAYDRAHGTLVAEHVTPSLAWVEYTTRAGAVIHLEYAEGES